MGRRGPAPKPKAHLELVGGKVRERHRDQVTAPPGAPLEPAWVEVMGLTEELAAAASAQWDRVVPPLDRSRILATTDWTVLVDHCVAWADYRQLVELVARQGHVIATAAGPKRNPNSAALVSARAALVASMVRLGLSPADRTRLVGGGGSDHVDATASDFTI